MKRTAKRADRAARDRGAGRGTHGATGSGLPVELVLETLERGADLAGVLAHHPELTADDVRACLAYATAAVRERRRPPQG